MRPSEVFEQARVSARRIRQIDEELRNLRNRIGQQGYSLGYHSKNGILDPMRKLIDAMDSEPDLEDERRQCLSDVAAAWSLINGMEHYVREMWSDADRAQRDGDIERSMSLYDEAGAAEGSMSVITMWSAYASSMTDIARSMHRPVGECKLMLRAALAWCDQIGMARLRSHVTYQ